MNSSDSCQNTLKPHFQTIFGIFRALLTRQDLFSKNQVSSLCLLYNYLTSYKKSEKTDRPFLRSYVANRRTNERMNGRTNRAKLTGHFDSTGVQ